MAIKKVTKAKANKVKSGPIPNIEWTTVGAEYTPGVCLTTIWGPTDSGKTTLALSAPGPIALLSSAEKLRGIVQPRVAEGAEVKVINFGFSNLRGRKLEDVRSMARDKVNFVMAAWEDAKSWAKTIIIDTDTALYQLLRLAHFGKLSQVMPHQYAALHAEYDAMFDYYHGEVEEPSHNLITVGKEKEEYKKDKGTGRMKHDGHKSMAYTPDIIIRTTKKRNTFRAEVLKAWMNAENVGLEFEDEMISFPLIASVVTNTDIEVWQ